MDKRLLTVMKGLRQPGQSPWDTTLIQDKTAAAQGGMQPGMDSQVPAQEPLISKQAMTDFAKPPAPELDASQPLGLNDRPAANPERTDSDMLSTMLRRNAALRKNFQSGGLNGNV